LKGSDEMATIFTVKVKCVDCEKTRNHIVSETSEYVCFSCGGKLEDVGKPFEYTIE
jgi:ribosomal protein S27E